MSVRKIFPFMLVIAAIASCKMTSAGTGAAVGMGYSGGSTSAVAISGFSFQPAASTISGGISLTWTNHDGVTHTVTTDTGVTPGFDSGNISPGASYRLLLTLPGTYTYHCAIHTSMKGTLIVQ